MAAIAVAGPVTCRAACPSGSTRRVTWRRVVACSARSAAPIGSTAMTAARTRRPKSAGVRVDASPRTRWQTARAAAGSRGSVSWARARACG